MNRTLLPLTAALGASSLLLVDSAIKGGAILVLAACVAMLLRRDSAATRHLVWLVAILAMLVVPVFSATLPQWQVLPAWAAISHESPATALPAPAVARPRQVHVQIPAKVNPVASEPPPAKGFQPLAEAVDSRPVFLATEVIPEITAPNWNWGNALPMLWASGVCVLILRLIAARWMLWNNERRGTVIGPSRLPNDGRTVKKEDEADEAIVAAFDAARRQLGIRQHVRVLMHAEQTIPVVWGIFRIRLLLPAAARQWSREQLRSVLLHELAHIKRRDTVVQLLAQVACALHWFNPLVWLAAWRLHVERERACDDLVLANGVRASAYAEHLLNVATKLEPVSWASVCGLTMARNSSLEGRLRAILSDHLNRRKVSATIGAIALIIGASIAIPIAMLCAADEPWNPPQAAHIGSNKFSTYCVHDGKTAAYIIAYEGDFGSATSGSSNSKTRTWRDEATLTLKTPAGTKDVTLRRDSTAPDRLTLGGRDYDLSRGRLFVVTDDGGVRQLAIEAPIVRNREAAEQLAERIAAIPPQEREPHGVDAESLQSELPRDWTARLLLKRWQALEERNTRLAEASVGRLRLAIDKWVKQPPVKADAGAVLALRDWQLRREEHPVAEVATWLDEIAAINREPLGFALNGETRVGATLDAVRQAALKFGPVAENGLRAAWSRYPARDAYAVGDVVSSSLVIQNASERTIEFRCPYACDDIISWKATEDGGRQIETKTVVMGSRGSIPIFTWRLKPGEVAEIGGRSAAIGEGDSSTVLLAKRGEQVSVEWSVREPVAMTTGAVSFKVVAVDDVPVWSTSQAGKWTMPGGVTMEVKQEIVHATDVMSTAMLTWPMDKAGGTARQQIWLGGDAFAAREPWLLAWERGATVLWKMTGQMQSSQDFRKLTPTPSTLTRIDFSDPEKITQTAWSYVPDLAPDAIRTEFAKAFLPLATTPPTPAHAEPSVQTSRADEVVVREPTGGELSPAANTAQTADDGYTKSGAPMNDLGAPIIWGAKQNGLALGMRIAEDAEWRIGKEVQVELWVSNPGEKDVKFQNIDRLDVGLRVLMTGKDGTEHTGSITMVRQGLFPKKILLPPGHAVKVREFAVSLSPPTVRPRKMNPVFMLAPGEYSFRCEHELMQTFIQGPDGKPLKPAAEIWTGTLKSGALDVTLVAAEADAKTAPAQAPDQWANVRIGADGALFLNRKPVTLEELNNFSRDFELPDGVKEEFRRLGLVIGRDKTAGRESLVGGNTGGEQVLAAETRQWIVEGTVTGADGQPLPNVPVRVHTEYKPTVDVAMTKTDAKGAYHLVFRLDLSTLAKFRGVAVAPVLEGFVDRELAQAGQFNALLYKGEKPRRPGDENAEYVGPETFAPGEMRRFAERDLVIGVPGRADFVLILAHASG